MNSSGYGYLRGTASYSVLDILLADIAVRIQLSADQLSGGHGATQPSTLDRPEDSPLHRKVRYFIHRAGS